MLRLKMAAVAAAVIGAMGVGASGAGAWTAPTAVGDSVQFQNSGGQILFGEFARCNSALSGQVDVDYGSLNGGRASLASASFTSCTIFTTVRGNFGAPWRFVVAGPSDAAGDAPASLSGVSLTVSAAGTCTYVGSISGIYNELTRIFTFADTLLPNGPCVVASLLVSGRYLVTNVTTSPGTPGLVL